MSRGHILLVDDDRDLLKAATDWLEINDFSVRAFHRPEEAYRQVMREEPDVVVSDIRMPGIDGMTLLTSIVRQRSDVPVILMTGHGDVTLAVKSMKEGAEDFIEKPYDADHLLSILDKAVEKRRMKKEIARLQGLVQAGEGVEIVGDSPAIHDLRNRVQMLAEVDIDVLIIGETGTGKELVAQALHRQSRRAAGPFVAINCAALPESIFESEVFGHAKGAFTGALSDRQGKFEHAAGGTVFLDEIESMPLGLQAKILRVLQERMIERLGENHVRPIDVRIVAAAKSDLSAEIAAGRFREDLFYRLATVDVRIPPLRQRRQDIGLLFGHFASLAARRHGRAERSVSANLLARLGQEEWRGNVRELKARAERFALGLDAAGSADGALGSADLPTLPEQVAAFEADVIRRTIEESDGSTARAATRLGIPHRTLNEKIARLGLRARRAEDEAAK
ncbi:sigma-54 dependent transcriptional regulator [Ensifer sp. LCM 4579]|uniref:sigma-54-dependent transcriptional regulator n=1 Tax=Ensifer sp. LCM 4579 TaxID=1848292 RepID=UPI0008D8ECD0|nr:sigma-54 dependent transcriptional regulator [Ensifer sp. LCM 4579]OHV72792.1 hypothetical protein LCM4579_11935 [Ensifer sp. LCM 4579]